MKRSPMKRGKGIEKKVVKKKLKAKKKPKKRKLLKICKLRDKVWGVFSKYIRLRESVDGWVLCYTCGKQVKALSVYEGRRCIEKGSEAGHFRHGKDREFYFNEDNVHPQCTDCNNYHKDWAGKKYALRMDADYGIDRTNELLSAKTTIWKRADLDEKLVYYKKKLEDIGIT